MDNEWDCWGQQSCQMLFKCPASHFCAHRARFNESNSTRYCMMLVVQGWPLTEAQGLAGCRCSFQGSPFIPWKRLDCSMPSTRAKFTKCSWPVWAHLTLNENQMLVTYDRSHWTVISFIRSTKRLCCSRWKYTCMSFRIAAGNRTRGLNSPICLRQL